MKFSGTSELNLKVYVKLSYFTDLKFLGVLWDVRVDRNKDNGEEQIVIEYIDEDGDLCGMWYKREKVERIEIHV